MRAPRKIDGLTLSGFIKRVRRELDEQCSPLSGWRRDWDEICEEEWRFGFTPSQAVERMEQAEGV